MNAIKVVIMGAAMLAPICASAQEATEVIFERLRSRQDIPRYDALGNEYKSWTIFVVCTPRWIGGSTQIHGLYDKFMRFGNAIGDSDVAIWPATRGGGYDSSTGARFCELLNLDPARGPHLITTTMWPGLARSPASYMRVSFANASPAVSEDLLEELTRQVIQQDFDPDKINTLDGWSRIRDAARGFMEFACPIVNRVSVSIKTPAFKISYESPKRIRDSDCKFR